MVNKLINLYSMCFDDSKEYIKYFFDKKYNRANTVIATDNNEVISELFLINKKIVLRGVSLSCPYVVGACTHPKFRGQGIMNSLIHDSFIKLDNRGAMLTALYPFRHSFYNKQGFMTINRMQKIIINYKKNSIIYRDANVSDAEIINKYYNNYCKNYDSYIVRNIKNTKDKINEVTAGSGTIIIAYDNQNVIGYVMYDNSEIIEIIGNYNLLFGIADLDGRECYVENHTGEEYAMLRIINAEKLLAKIKYPININMSINLGITDDFYTNNSNFLNLKINNGNAIVKSSDDCDLMLTIEELTLLIAGAYDREGYMPPDILREIFPPTKLLIYDKY